MYELKKNWKVILPVNLLVPGPRLIKKKKNLPGRGLTKIEKHCSRRHRNVQPYISFVFVI